MDYDEMITCNHCSRVWDGGAQCPCTIYLSDEEEDIKCKYVNISTQTKKLRVWGPNKLQIAQEAVDKLFN